MQATDIDSGNGSIIWFSVETPDAPFVVDRDTGEVRTAGVFRGLSGKTIDIEVRAFDNFGIPPTESSIDTLSVRPIYTLIAVNHALKQCRFWCLNVESK